MGFERLAESGDFTADVERRTKPLADDEKFKTFLAAALNQSSFTTGDFLEPVTHGDLPDKGHGLCQVL